ncbi:Golgi mannosyltransferase complex subunit [Vermiconidia calcicola]|uniref:Golgi mannosyltransferase complex subunit n=1 Tax=Vermiconidia calcicola TaxID=1690605 RepID=A0ACC3NT63_9PEZI|nr:Golgi mannosyltransferase complex subunit [Vermiconidia calcicola]
MPVVRPVRRNSTITYILAGILCIFFLYFFFGDDASLPSIPAAPRQLILGKEAAANALSPPSLPFRKPAKLGPDEVAPPPPVVHYQMNNVSQTATPIENRETVLILTPLARFYQEYWDNLCKLSYPHDLISLGFIIPKGREGNMATQQLQERIQQTQAPTNKNRFASITILRQDTEAITAQGEADRHALDVQKDRRAAMSRARNSLLFTTLGPTTSWVLWLDSDIVESPPSLIQDLASHNKPVIVPNCFQRYFNRQTEAWETRPYDFNSWQDSPTAQGLAEKMGPEEILLEGYAEMATYRSLMAYMGDSQGDPRAEVDLDGVGGTALLVKADVHRDGAMFPPFPFYHLIETEGFAKMASRLGWKSFGLPNYFVYHYNE